MTLLFQRTIQEALQQIECIDSIQFTIYDKEISRVYEGNDAILEKYGLTKWTIVEILNEFYHETFDLQHWIEKNKDDEVAYFLNEVGSNALNHAEFKTPSAFQLWIGTKGFVIGVEQKGQAFNASLINEMKLRTNEGGAFEFFRNCRNKVFFDDAEKARIVYLEYVF